MIGWWARFGLGHHLRTTDVSSLAISFIIVYFTVFFFFSQWKFDQLDRNSDNQLDGRDLKEFRYALMPLEHCASKFFSMCDIDKSSRISFDEWTDCLMVRFIYFFISEGGRPCLKICVGGTAPPTKDLHVLCSISK